MTNQRIKLAEFTGEIIKVRHSLPYPNGLGWKSPQGDVRPIPDPRNDANDCEALIRKLGDHGFEPQINFWVSHVEIRLDHNGHPDGPTIHRYSGHNWKHGVCDLAEKVIETAENGRATDGDRR